MFPALLSLVTPLQAMQAAVDVAYSGLGFVGRNPLVGAVAVDRDHRFLAAAGHLEYGGPHAEVRLVEQIRNQGLMGCLAGGTIYVTLEPCSHFGKTPPCADLLAALPIAKVVYAQRDPNPKVDGRGVARLLSSGIACVSDATFAALAARSLAPFVWSMQKATPYVALKAARTKDGVYGMAGQAQAPITGVRSQRLAHWLRMLYDGVVVGADTVIVDNPLLTVRQVDLPRLRTPLRIVLDAHLRALRSRPLSAHHILQTEPEKTLWVATPQAWAQHSEDQQALAKLGTRILGVAQDANGFVVPDLLRALYGCGVSSVLLEGGRGVWDGFLNAGAVQYCHLFFAPQTLGHLKNALRWDAFFEQDARFNLRHTSRIALEPDWCIEGEPTYESADDGNRGGTFGPASEF